jgi:hAT family protein
MIYGGKINQLQIARGDEFDSFIDGNPVLLGERETSLSWWLEEVQRHIYPTLSRFVIDILSIPAVL